VVSFAPNPKFVELEVAELVEWVVAVFVVPAVVELE
jgi:hypothetical protein